MNVSDHLVMVWRIGEVIFRTPRGDSQVLLRSNGRLYEVCPLCGEKAVDHHGVPEDGFYRARCITDKFGQVATGN